MTIEKVESLKYSGYRIGINNYQGNLIVFGGRNDQFLNRIYVE